MSLTTDESKPLPAWAYGPGQPEHLARLGESGWPSPVITAIADLFSRAGIQDPYQQKLVEPTARVFGGGKNGDLSGVNWGMVVDYFTWEIASLTDADEAERLQEMAIKKYGGIWFHYPVYSVDGLY